MNDFCVQLESFTVHVVWLINRNFSDEIYRIAKGFCSKKNMYATIVEDKIVNSCK